jgi:hypothetical protein
VAAKNEALVMFAAWVAQQGWHAACVQIKEKWAADLYIEHFAYGRTVS